MKKVIFCVGNPLVKEDSFPLELAKILSKKLPFKFIKIYSTEDFENEVEKIRKINKGDVILIDTVKGIKKIEILDLNETHSKIKFAHDFDVCSLLKIYKKIGLIKKVKIIGIPSKINNKKKITKEIYHLIKDF